MHQHAGPTLLGALRDNFRKVLLATGLATALLVGLSFLIPNEFTAISVVLPPRRDSGLAGLLGNMNGVDIGRAMGIGVQKDTDLYIGVLRSRTIGSTLVTRFHLMDVYKTKDPERAARILTQHTAITLTNEDLVKISVTEKDRHLAADLANSYVDELDLFLRENTNSSAHRSRVFLEQRLDETRHALADAEEALRDYQVTHRMPAVGSEVERTADAAAELVAQKVSREIELGTLETVSKPDNPRAVELRNEIQQFDTEIVKIPPAAMGVARLFRDVKIQEKILLVLTEEYEGARVLELKDMPTVEVVDRAVPPLRKSQPKRGAIAAASLVVTFGANWALFALRQGVLRLA